ncbi:MAG TPA: hypothetical protein VFA10_27110 [Ktedonobacteraceae bacterium]|nr:hypothetical protein [Ktedonobacteraceae bacterium]
MQQGEPSPKASQVIDDLLGLVSRAQVIAYLERTGWKPWANHFERGKGWSMRPEVTKPASWIYVKPDPDAEDEDDSHFVVEVPGNEAYNGYLSKLEFAIERIAAVEQTTFLTVICRILGIQELVLRPIETDPTSL